jgi:SAM-dependent methyltransferase
MVAADLDYVRRLIADKVITGPVLELGVAYGGATSRAEVTAAGLAYFGTDMTPGSGVDYAANFEKLEDMGVFRPIGLLGSVLILNVLEHTFDPIRILDNAATLLRRGGVIVVITPAVWPLHNFPMDAWRFLPNFYEEYAKRRGFKLLDQYFDYVGIGPVASYRNPDSSYAFPPPCKPGLRYQMDRAIHKVFNTFGRLMRQPSYIGVGAVLVVE